MRDPMLDEDFLHELDLYHHHHTWAKIISLDFNEYPLEEITGKISSGSINIDGNSAVRRTCSLTLLSDEVDINDFYWGLKTKFRLLIGIENKINDQYIIKKKESLQNSIDEAKANGTSTEDLRYCLEHIEELYRYPDIIWFNQGIFLVSSFSCTAGVNNYTVSIQGKDKMSLLNGDMGGVIPASWDFGTMDENMTDEEGNTAYDSAGYAIVKNTQIPIKEIVLQAVHEFAQEKWQNIIVNDLDDFGIELLEYNGNTPLYYIIKDSDSGVSSREVINMTLDGDTECLVKIVDWIDGQAQYVGWADSYTYGTKNSEGEIVTKILPVKIRDLDSDWISSLVTTDGARANNPPKYSYERLIDQLDPSGAVTETKNYYRARIAFPDDTHMEIAYDDDGNQVELPVYNEYTVAKITRDNGLNVCGYRICDIVYPYDLIAAPGETVTSVLDKLVKMLGNFEYFFDEEGRFIFQKKRTYLDVSYNNIINEHSISPEVWADSSMFSSKYSYTFDSNTLVSSIQNAPNLSNLKNDYSLWGSRQNGDITIPIHMRYALDKKPYGYRTYNKVDEDGTVRPGAWYWTKEGIEYRDKRLAILREEFKGENNSSVNTFKKYTFTKPENKNGLPSTWWEVQDWARYYGRIACLQDGVDPDTISDEKLQEDYFPKQWLMYYKSDESVYPLPTYREVADLIGTSNSNINYDDNSRLQMIIQQEDGSWTSHGENCSHSYFQFIPNYRVLDEDGNVKIYHDEEHNKNIRMETYQGIYSNTKVYIYRPTFPGELEVDYEEGTITVDLSGYSNWETYIVDWREVIYQMANDYRAHYREDDFLVNVSENNKMLYYNNVAIESLYPTGYTGYENYYIDFEMNLSQGVVAYWRELYNPAAIYNGLDNQSGYYTTDGEFHLDKDVADWEETVIYKRGERAAIYEDGERKIFKSLKNNNKESLPTTSNPNWLYSPGDFIYDSDGWNINILNNPEILNFWFDFLDTTGEMNKYSVHNIGLRSKATNDDKIKAIYFRETPNVIFDVAGETVQKNNWIKPGYCYLNIPAALNDLFYISSRGKNCMDVIEEYLYNYAYPISSITLNTIPIYYLTPNTLIYVNDPDTGVIGEYIMTKYSIQLGLSAQMAITGTETSKRLY